MVDIRDYIKISDTAYSITSLYLNPREFLEKYFSILETERDSFIRYTIINNTPYAFKGYPLLYEQVTQYLADKLAISPNYIKLIGSARTGFSMSPPPEFGKKFSNESDLDFSIINSTLFSALAKEFESWAEQYSVGDLQPLNGTQGKYWAENLNTCERTINRGFIDTNKVPSYNQFIKTQTINNSMYFIKDMLRKVHGLTISKASARVYKDWSSFARQLKINTEFILEKAKGVRG